MKLSFTLVAYMVQLLFSILIGEAKRILLTMANYQWISLVPIGPAYSFYLISKTTLCNL
jgi:hypothetical protein